MKRTATPEWIKLRKEILSRDGKRCRYPKCTHEGNEVHHIIPHRISNDDSPLNQVLLCKKHHCIADNQYFKYGRTSQADIWLKENYKIELRKEAKKRYARMKKYKPGTPKCKRK